MSGKLPKDIIALGFVSLLMDMSSEMIHSLLPVFLVGTLGVSAMTVGLIEGVAEATAAFAKVFSGVISDLWGRRKPLVLAGYGLAALTKPLFALATGAGTVFTARFIDRIGKGIRGAPRDALIADVTPPELRGAAYGLRQAMDSVGAVLGPLAAVVFMTFYAGDFRLAFWAASVPAFFCVALIVFGVREPGREKKARAAKFPIHKDELARLPAGYWLAVVFAFLLTLSRFSEAFLLLRASSVGISAAFVPLALLVMNLIFSLSAYPLGLLADRANRGKLFAAGIWMLIAADIVLALAKGPLAVFSGVALWGLHMGATQGLLSVVVADASPADLRGTAFGVFHLATGAALIAASFLAGGLWEWFGPSFTFAAGGVFAALSLIFLGILRHRAVF